MVSAWSIYKSEEEAPEATTDEDESENGNWVADKIKDVLKTLKRHIKANYLSEMAVLATILTIAIHSTHITETNSYLMAFKGDSHELKMFEARSSFELAAVCQNNKCDSRQMNITVRNEDYRKVYPMENNTIYVDQGINVTNLPNILQIIEDSVDWDEIISDSHYKLCKRCIKASNPQLQRCKTLSFEGSKIENCRRGKQKINLEQCKIIQGKDYNRTILYVYIFFSLDACPLPNIQHGKWDTRIDSTSNRRLHIATLRCDDGYGEADAEERLCSPDGLVIGSNSQYLSPNIWSGKQPECGLPGMV